MKYIQAIVAFGLFTWLGLAVLAGTFSGAEGGSREAQVFLGLVKIVTDRFGQEATGFGVLTFGLVFGWSLLIKGSGRRAT
ncbi:MAG: hypothetical protein KJN93_02825 [Alphaproteobacteria bacterium]|nr:hypothetical protein [Alphaproteobacteria bacterium]NNF25507.1 hypothetical protein [Paracoccaceae bacterium]